MSTTPAYTCGAERPPNRNIAGTPVEAEAARGLKLGLHPWRVQRFFFRCPARSTTGAEEVLRGAFFGEETV
jgi:hypothetical protein